jgi:hypothetical protein
MHPLAPITPCASGGHVERALEGSPDGGLSDLVLAGKVRHGLAGRVPLGDLSTGDFWCTPINGHSPSQSVCLKGANKRHRSRMAAQLAGIVN